MPVNRTAPLLSLSEPLARIEQAAGQIQSRDGGAFELGVIRANLIAIAGLVERDPGLETAADDLFAAARAVIAGEPHHPPARLRRLLQDALARFRVRLGSAREIVDETLDIPEHHAAKAA